MIDKKDEFAVVALKENDPDRIKIAGASPHPCSRCDEDVMVSPSSRKIMKDGTVVLCLGCASAIVRERGQGFSLLDATEDQIQESKDNVSKN